MANIINFEDAVREINLAKTIGSMNLKDSYLKDYYDDAKNYYYRTGHKLGDVLFVMDGMGYFKFPRIVDNSGTMDMATATDLNFQTISSKDGSCIKQVFEITKGWSLYMNHIATFPNNSSIVRCNCRTAVKFLSYVNKWLVKQYKQYKDTSIGDFPVHLSMVYTQMANELGHSPTAHLIFVEQFEECLNM